MLWLLLCGLEMTVAWVLLALVLACTIVGIPFGVQAFTLARLALRPFGKKIVRAA